MHAVFKSVTALLLMLLCVAPGSQAQQSVTASDAAVEARLQAMTLKEQVAQMFMVSFYGRPLNIAAREMLQEWQPGGVVLLPSNLGTPEQVTALTNQIQAELTTPALIAVDQEGGLIAHLEDGFTEWPVPSLLTASGDTALAEAFGAALAAEMRAVGVQMNLAPVADLHTNPANPVIGRRAFGSDAQEVAPIVAAVVRGMQSGGVLATVKHFPGHGDTADDSHAELPVLSHRQEFLMQRELVPFEAAITDSAGAIMTAHIYFPELEPIPDTPASLSEAIVTGLLREQLGYQGIIITDALDMDAIDTRYSAAEASLRAIQAGNDMVLVGAHVSPQTQMQAMQYVYQAVQNGDLSTARIEDSVRRILQAKARFNLLEHSPLDPTTASDRIPLDDHSQLVTELFRKGITLVEGELPLPDNTAFIYPATRPSLWQTCQADTWQGVGVSLYPSEADISRAVSTAARSDAVVVFTQNVRDNPQQQALVEALPAEKTRVIALWSPYDRRYLPQTAGYMVTYSPLLASHDPLCDILHGREPARRQLSLMIESRQSDTTDTN